MNLSLLWDYDFYVVLWAFRIVFDNISCKFCKVSLYFLAFGILCLFLVKLVFCKLEPETSILSTWERYHVLLWATSFAPFYFEFYFPPSHLYVRPQKVSQDCFLWNWMAPFNFCCKCLLLTEHIFSPKENFITI